MDKKKKKWKKKPKAVPFADPGELAVDNPQSPDDFTGRPGSPGMPNDKHGISRSGPADEPRVGRGAEVPAKFYDFSKSRPPCVSEEEARVLEEADSTHGTECVGGPHGLDKIEIKGTQQRGREERHDRPATGAPVQDDGTWHSAQSLPFLVENARLLTELRESQRELNAQRETSELLRDQVNAQVEQFTANINRVAAENERLQNMVESLRVDMLRLKTENVELQISVNKRAETERLTVQRLEMDNFELQSLAASRKDEIISLEEESRQMSANMMALQRGIQQLERKVSVRAHIEQDLGSATSEHDSKRWDGWTVKDPLAIAAAVAEESRLQKLAVAQTIEKLLQENDQLIRKVNEQAFVINDLTFSLHCKPMTNTRATTDINGEDVKPSFVVDSTTEGDDISRALNGHSLEEINYHRQHVNGHEESGANVELPTRSAIMENHPNIRPMQPPKGAPAREQEIEELTVASDTPLVPVENSTSVLSEQRKPVPGPGRRIVTRPFRLISFVAGYISGADLVKN